MDFWLSPVSVAGFACLPSTELAQDLQILSGFTSGFTNPIRIYVRIDCSKPVLVGNTVNPSVNTAKKVNTNGNTGMNPAEKANTNVNPSVNHAKQM